MALKGIKVKKVEDTTDSVPEGKLSYSFANLGTVDATLTQNGSVFTLPAGSVFNMPVLPGNDAWYGTSINATGTVVECVYF